MEIQKLLFSCEKTKGRGKNNLILVIRNIAASAESQHFPQPSAHGKSVYYPAYNRLCMHYTALNY